MRRRLSVTRRLSSQLRRPQETNSKTPLSSIYSIPAAQQTLSLLWQKVQITIQRRQHQRFVHHLLNKSKSLYEGIENNLNPNVDTIQDIFSQEQSPLPLIGHCQPSLTHHSIPHRISLFSISPQQEYLPTLNKMQKKQKKLIPLTPQPSDISGEQFEQFHRARLEKGREQKKTHSNHHSKHSAHTNRRQLTFAFGFEGEPIMFEAPKQQRRKLHLLRTIYHINQPTLLSQKQNIEKYSMHKRRQSIINNSIHAATVDADMMRCTLDRLFRKPDAQIKRL